MSAITSVDGGLLTGVEVAAWLEDEGYGTWTPDTLRKWIVHPTHPCPVARRGKPGREHLYDPHEVAAWVASRDAADARDADPDADLKRQRARLVRLQADELEGLLVPAAEQEAAFGQVVDATRTAILALEHVLSDRLHLTDEQRAIVGEEIRSVLERLSKGETLEE